MRDDRQISATHMCDSAPMRMGNKTKRRMSGEGRAVNDVHTTLGN